MYIIRFVFKASSLVYEVVQISVNISVQYRKIRIVTDKNINT